MYFLGTYIGYHKILFRDYHTVLFFVSVWPFEINFCLSVVVYSARRTTLTAGQFLSKMQQTRFVNKLWFFFRTWCIYSCTLSSHCAEMLGIIMQRFNSSTGCRVYSLAWQSHFSRHRVSPKVLHGDILSNGKSKCARMTDLDLNNEKWQRTEQQ